MNGLRRHGTRIAITLLPVLLALLHAAGVWRLPLLVRLDQFIYDARLRATMPGTLDPRIVIVDIDEPSLQQLGQWPWSRDKEISVGIGLNTGLMSVGDMGSAVRRSYIVVGDAVNLASRLEGLSSRYGVEIVASAATQGAAPGFAWQELDFVRVKGKARAVRIFTPVGHMGDAAEGSHEALVLWARTLDAYRAQDWHQALDLLAPLLAIDAKKVLYRLYAERLASLALQPKDSGWDGATRFDSK